MTNDAWFPFKTEHPAPRLRLFCFAHAGGNAALFRSWPASAPPEIDICPVQLPGRGARIAEPPHRRIDDLLDAFEAAARPRLDLPFAVFGHSMGAWVAWEAARRLRSHNGRGAVHLFVSANVPPPRSFPRPRYSGASEADLLDLLRRFGGTPPELLEHAELMAALLPAFAADLALLDTYCTGAGVRLDCPITACGGQDDSMHRPEDLDAWSALTGASFERWTFPGGHFYLEASRGSLLQKIFRILPLARI